MKNKKYLGVLGLGCAALLLTGCGGNKLTCTNTEEQDGFGKSTEKIVFNYDKDGKKIESLDMEMSIELESDEMIDMYKGFLDQMCEDEDAPSDCKVKTSGKKLTLTASGKAEDMDYEEGTSMEEVREELEEEGYTCK
ncbi:MAG: hypothetical protein J6A52_02295 [Bacilli bacterium]|nr:hypothetical protein [Bacilli bacterium]